jgi:hypothetical protein
MRGIVVGALGVSALVVGAAGCGNETLKSGGRDAGALVPDAGAPGRDTAPEGLVVVGGPVSGTFVAPGVSASIAFPDGAGFLEETFEPAPYRFYLGTGNVGSLTQVTFNDPSGVARAAFSVSLQIGAPLPRAWASASGCGSIVLTGYFPPDADASCGGFTDAGICPPGCTPRVTLEGGGSDCLVLAPTISYRAFTTAQCSLGSEPAEGDWTLSLTSVDTNFVVDGVLSSPGLYLVHGTLMAHLVGGTSQEGMQGGADGGDGGLATGTLRLDF